MQLCWPHEKRYERIDQTILLDCALPQLCTRYAGSFSEYLTREKHPCGKSPPKTCQITYLAKLQGLPGQVSIPTLPHSLVLIIRLPLSRRTSPGQRYTLVNTWRPPQVCLKFNLRRTRECTSPPNSFLPHLWGICSPNLAVSSTNMDSISRELFVCLMVPL